MGLPPTGLVRYVIGAEAAGVSTVLFDPLGCEERPADYVITDLKDLYEVVLRWEQTWKG